MLKTFHYFPPDNVANQVQGRQKYTQYDRFGRIRVRCAPSDPVLNDKHCLGSPSPSFPLFLITSQGFWWVFNSFVYMQMNQNCPFVLSSRFLGVRRDSGNSDCRVRFNTWRMFPQRWMSPWVLLIQKFTSFVFKPKFSIISALPLCS